MCGITGAFALRPQPSWNRDRLLAQVGAMSTAIGHRGPDDQGVWSHASGCIALGHRRLAIVDLSARGHQPMHYGGRYVIAFNGEIYNFRELREALLSAGHRFVSSTDTEVIMAAVQEWGIERALQRMVGMFAFALWDEHERQLILARDRLGEKPLYLAIHDGYLLFASELHGIEAVDGLKRELSQDALSLYLSRGYVPAPLSMYEGVFKLPQASYMRMSAQSGEPLSLRAAGAVLEVRGAVLTRYWSVESLNAPQTNDEQVALEQLEALLSQSVNGQMQCDVPMGVFLSGGIDSTVVAAATQRLSAAPVSTFTVKFDVPGFDESAHAAAVARHLGTQHHEIRIDSADLLAAVPVQAASFDEPTANASYFPLRMMAAAAREHVKVVLSGDAGDELFGGYNRYKLTPPLWRRFAWLPVSARRLLARGAGAIPVGLLSSLNGSAGMSGQTNAAASIKKMRRFLDAPTLGQSYQRLMRCWDAASHVAHVTDPVERPLSCDEASFLASATALDLQTYLPDDNLAKSDRATMAAGLEQRVPLLDHRIVEFARTLPDTMMIKGGVSKWLLRQLAYRYVPREILDRPKMGFTVPVRDWLRGPLRQWAGDLLHSESLLSRGLLRQNAVHAHWAKLQNDDASSSWELWSLVMYLAWLGARTSAGAAQLRRTA